MDSFVFHNPTRVIFGAGALSKLSRELPKLGISKPLIVIGQGSVIKYGHLHRLEKILLQLEIPFTLFQGICPNPTTDDIENAVKILKGENCDSLIALGGGSVMDSAKVIALVADQGGKAWDYTGSFLAKGAPVKTALPIITIPTVAATGSEADPIAVISNPHLQIKNSISGFALFPKLAIVDPELTLTCPWNTTVDGIMDILSHASETYFSNPLPHPIQDGISEAIIKTVLETGAKLKMDLNNVDYRSEISWASTLTMAGFLSGRNGGWPLHAMEHQISAYYPQISHGSGLAALFLPLLEWNATRGGLDKFKCFVKNVFGREIQNFSEGSALIKERFSLLGLCSTLEELGVEKERLPAIARSAHELKSNKEGLLVNVKPLTLEDINSILLRAFS